MEAKLKIGQHVAFRQTGVNTGVIVGMGHSQYNGQPTIKVRGTCGSRGATVQARQAERIPGPDEVIVSREHWEKLLADSADLERLENFGVRNWEGYDLALRSED